MAGAVLPEEACGEPDDVGVIAISATGRLGWRLACRARAGLVDGAGGVADGGVDALLWVVMQLGEVAALGAEDLGELDGFELGGVGGRGAARAVSSAIIRVTLRREVDRQVLRTSSLYLNRAHVCPLYQVSGDR